jgi:hypothetical protein
MSEDWSDMSDDNENGTQGEQGEEQKPEPSPYLSRSTMLPVEGVVYCLEHTVVHADTENPYGEGPESWCKKDEHRSIYYRGHKGDLDERVETEPNGAPRPRIAAATSNNSRLTKAERGLVLRLTRTLHTTLSNTRETLSQILGKDAVEGRESDPLLKLTESILDKLGDEGGEPDGS